MDEVSKDKLQSYVASAVQDYGSAENSNGAKRVKRYVGIDRAISKLGKGARVKATEENATQVAAATIIDGFANLNRQKKAEFVDYLKRTFHDPNNYEEKPFQEELDSTLDELFPDEETKIKAAELFYEAVNAKGSQLQDGLVELLSQYSPYLIEGDDVIDILGDHIQQLKNAITQVESENHRLAHKVTDRLSENYKLNKDTVVSLWSNSDSFDDLEQKCQQAVKTEPAPKKSHIDEQLEEINDDTTFAQGETYIPENMKPYLRFLQ